MEPRPDAEALDKLFLDMRRSVGPPPEIPGYTVLERAGTGTFGSVYRARDLQLERDVALKVLHPTAGVGPEAEERFLQEARTLARVRHPNVVTLFGVVEHNGIKALSTEYIEGQSLEAVAVEEGRLAPRDVIRIGCDLCGALAAVHAAGIIHRDVKTTNILRERGGRMVLADFGLGAYLKHCGTAGRRTYAAGTPVFMAPEVLDGGHADVRSDLYSLGVVLYRLAAGSLPFEGNGLDDLTRRILRGESRSPPPARDESERGLWSVVNRAISVDPQGRYQSAEEMEAALTVLAVPAAAPAEAPRGRRRLGPVAGAAAVLALAFLGFLLRGLAPASGEFEASARILHTDTGNPSRATHGDRQLRVLHRGILELQANADLHVYIVGEDSRGRRFLLYPRSPPEGEERLQGGRVHVLGARQRDLSLTGLGDCVAVIASRDPLHTLFDSIPPKGSSEETGKDGTPRLKPIAVKGLLRSLAQAGWIKDTDQADGETEPLLAKRLPRLPASGPSREGIWAAQHTFSSDPGEGDEKETSKEAGKSP